MKYLSFSRLLELSFLLLFAILLFAAAWSVTFSEYQGTGCESYPSYPSYPVRTADNLCYNYLPLINDGSVSTPTPMPTPTPIPTATATPIPTPIPNPYP